jgi:hypothetical protein
VTTERAEGGKCLRCWRICKETGYSPRFPGVCARCVQMLHEIRFPAYKLTGKGSLVEILPGQEPGVKYNDRWVVEQ